jgi:hypothetical protein
MLMRSFNVKGNLLLNGIMRNIGWIVSNFAIFCISVQKLLSVLPYSLLA